MSVQDIRFKLILCLCMIFPPLLLSYSNAVYLENSFNFFTGISPYYTLGATGYDNTYFYPQDGTDNMLQGNVVSFDNTIMSGSQPPNAVPLVDSAFLTGKVAVLPPNSCVAINTYSTYVYGSHTFHISCLGSTMPYTSSSNISTLTPGNISGFQVAYSTNGPITTSTTFNSMDSCLIGNREVTYYNNFSNPMIYLVLNDSDEPLYLSNVSSLVSGSPTVTYNMPYLDSSEVCMLFYDVEFSLNNTTYTGYRFVVPHIAGMVDLYTPLYSNLYINNSTYYRIRAWDNIICSIGTTQAGNIYVGIDYKTAQRYSNMSVNIAISTAEKNPDYVPYYINSVYTTQKKAIWIKNGYVAITNYDELIDKLQEAGIGQADLSRVIALLEEINTGGEIGEATKQLISILETYHNNLVQQGDSDWSAINNTYDDIKHWLDFSGNTIHWIVTANNSLFNYFSGFILLCAFFLVIDRIMRG